MTRVITLDGVVCDSVPPELALHPYGCFTTLLVEWADARPSVLGWRRHLARLTADADELWGHRLDPELVRRRLVEHVQWQAQVTSAVRITLYPATFELGRPELAEGVRVLVSSGPAPRDENTPFRASSVEHQRGRAHLKSTDLLGQIASRRAARLAGSDDALLVDGAEVLEGSTWSVVAWRDGEMRAPETRVLGSTTVAALAEVAQSLGYVPRGERLLRDDLFASTLTLAVSVTQPVRVLAELDGRPLPVDHALLGEVRRRFAGLERDRL